MKGNMHVLKIHILLVVPLVTLGTIPDIPFFEQQFSLILASLPSGKVKPLNVSVSGWSVSSFSNAASLCMAFRVRNTRSVRNVSDLWPGKRNWLTWSV